MSVKTVIMSLVIKFIQLVGLLPLFKANTFLKTRYLFHLFIYLIYIPLIFTDVELVIYS